MDATATYGGRTAHLRPRAGSSVVTTLVSLLSAAAFVWMRAGMNLPSPQFQGACDRLREAGLAITPQDVFCQPIPWTSHAAYVVGSFLIAVGFVLPGVILAASGHRLTAFLPLLVAPAVSYPQGLIFPVRWWGSTTWPRGATASTAVTMLVMAAPVAAVMFATRGSRVSRPQLSLISGIVAALACGAGVVAVVFATQGVLARHFGELVADVGVQGVVPAVIAIAIFGALLGPDRRWWPWSLVPVAMLLSAAPSFALIVGPQRILDWSQFGIVVPLFVTGLVGSAWKPLAVGLARLFPDEEEAWQVSTPSREHARIDADRIRPVVVLNATALGLLAVSLIVFRADPSPVQYGESLPTYLGARSYVQDVRAKMDLRQALTAMDAYQAERGTYRGFDAEIATAADPSLAWMDSLPKPESQGTLPEPTVSIVSATDREARVAAISDSGTAFCLQRTGGGLAYGSGPRPGLSGLAGGLQEAVAGCGSTLWTTAAIRPFPIATMCDGLGASGGYLICRMVQAFMTETMQGT